MCVVEVSVPHSTPLGIQRSEKRRQEEDYEEEEKRGLSCEWWEISVTLSIGHREK